MNKINVFELLNSANAVGPSDGSILRERVEQALKVPGVVTIDFTGIAVFASPFFNYSIAQLLKNYSAQVLGRRLRYVGLVPAGHRVLKSSVDRAKVYFSESEPKRRALDAVASQEMLAH